MFCAISGEPPSEPVVSVKSGQLYEARLIRKYVDENGKDPITGDALQHDDLVAVKALPRIAAPRPPSHSSIPSLLAALQTEYDGMALQLFTLKKNYEDVRMELAHALYANDAAARVVARLMAERDEARAALASISGSLGVAAPAPAAGDAEMQDAQQAGPKLPAAAAAIVESTAKTLSSQRRAKMKRKAPAGYASRETIPSYTQLASLPSMHSTKPPGVTALDVSASGTLLLTGGADKQVQVYDRAAERTIATLKGHTKRITRVVFSPSAEGDAGAPAYAVSASEDHTVRVWACADVSASPPSYALTHVLKGHKAEVTGLDIHASGALCGSASRDGTWALWDLASGERLLAVDAPEGETPEEAEGGYAYESFAFHPDGQLAATGTAEGVVRVWDILAVQKVSTFRGDATPGAASALAFAENGYQLAVGGRASGRVCVWDLRKLAVAATLEGTEGGSVSALRFDPTAAFLAAVGTETRVWANKSWGAPLLCHEGNSAEVTGVAWDARDGSIVTSSLDRTVRTLGVAKAE